MKRLLESVGLITVVCLSFFYTEKTVNVVKEYDDIMIAIKEKKDTNRLEPIDAKIEKNTIIPGIHGQKVNENKSYSKMKRYGSFNSSLMVYEEIQPNISVSNNLDKYIIQGNKEKNMISLIFLVQGNDQIDAILSILQKKEIQANFFVDSTWLEENETSIGEMITAGHNIGSLGKQGDYTDSDYPWVDNKIKTTTNQKFGYCYNEVEDIQSLELCASYNNYTIRPNIIIESKPLMEVKEKISPGSMISFKVNDQTSTQLPLIIEYIKSKGYTIATLEEHLSE